MYGFNSVVWTVKPEQAEYVCLAPSFIDMRSIKCKAPSAAKKKFTKNQNRKARKFHLDLQVVRYLLGAWTQWT